MPRVVPRQVVELIDRIFGLAIREEKPTTSGLTLELNHAAHMAAIVDLASQIPAELLPVDSDRYAEFSASIAALRVAQQMWEAHGSYTLKKMPGFAQSPVFLIRRALEGLPDSVPDPKTAGLEFLDEDRLRAVLRLDISDAAAALRSGEWKAATVLSGSVVEALLLWAVKKHSPPERATASAWIPLRGRVKEGPTGNPDRWGLADYVDVATELGCISEDTRSAAWLTKNFRNLIHPAAAERAGEDCNLGTAHIAVGTVDRVSRDLARKGVNGTCP
jgi:hypothetical protein